MPHEATPSFAHQYVFEPGSDPAAPPLLLLHGTGGTEHDLLRIGRSISPGSALLSPRGNVNEAGALRFFARLAEGVFDPAEVTRRTHTLADFILAASAHHGIDPTRLIALGFSNGANIAATLLLLRPETLAGAILLRPMVVLDQPAQPATLTGKRVLICHGSTDPLVPAHHPNHLASLFRAGGADTKIAVIAASHSLTPQDVAAAQAWIRPA